MTSPIFLYRLILTDNTTESIHCAELSLGNILYQFEYLPGWVTFILSGASTMPAAFSDIDAVREKYCKMKGNEENELGENLES